MIMQFNGGFVPACVYIECFTDGDKIPWEVYANPYYSLPNGHTDYDVMWEVEEEALLLWAYGENRMSPTRAIFEHVAADFLSRQAVHMLLPPPWK